MNILFLTLSNITDINERGIYTDLIRELAKNDCNVFVASPRQKREKLPTELIKHENVSLLKIKTGNITKVNSTIEKGISTLLIENQYLRAIKKYFKKEKFDLVLYSTPPITFNRIIKYFKKKHNSKTYLLLKDIFPQNAVDIELVKKGSLLHKMFRQKEKELYKISDRIGCMSQGNVDYILSHNDFLDRKHIEVFPNSISPVSKKSKRKKDISVLSNYNLPKEDVLFIYGGNLGKPQGIDFLKQVIENFYKVKKAHLLIVGDGTEFNHLNDFIADKQPENVSIFRRLPKKDYDILIQSADVGLIFLDHRFTIPNFPSRLTSYMENCLPVLVATDVNTDLKDVILESDSGYWCQSTDVDEFIKSAKILNRDKFLRKTMGLNGRRYLENNYDIKKKINILLNNIVVI